MVLKEQIELIKNGAKYQAVKLHIQTNKRFYLGIGVGALIVLVVRRPSINVTNAPVFNNFVG